MKEELEKLNNEYVKAKQEQEKTSKRIKELTRQIEKVKQGKLQDKEYNADFKKLMNKVLKDYFVKHYFSRRELNGAYNDLRLTETRNNIIEYIADNEKEFDYLNEIYENVLQKTYKIYKNDYDAKQELQLNETKNTETETTKKDKFIILAVCLISVIPFIYLMFTGMLETFKGWLILFSYVIIVSIIGDLIIIFHGISKNK